MYKKNKPNVTKWSKNKMKQITVVTFAHNVGVGQADPDEVEKKNEQNHFLSQTDKW